MGGTLEEAMDAWRDFVKGDEVTDGE